MNNCGITSIGAASTQYTMFFAGFAIKISLFEFRPTGVIKDFLDCLKYFCINETMSRPARLDYCWTPCSDANFLQTITALG
jgi:hypothetical protein